MNTMPPRDPASCGRATYASISVPSGAVMETVCAQMLRSMPEISPRGLEPPARDLGEHAAVVAEDLRRSGAVVGGDEQVVTGRVAGDRCDLQWQACGDDLADPTDRRVPRGPATVDSDRADRVVVDDRELVTPPEHGAV